jgi:hypothetical protein
MKQKNEFSYRNMVIHRDDFNVGLLNMNTEGISDEQMQALAEEMYNTLMDLDWSGIDKDTMKKYLEGGELDRGDDLELYDMAFDEIEERLLLRHGAFYPEDESTDAAVQIENRINNDMFNAQYMR